EGHDADAGGEASLERRDLVLHAGDDLDGADPASGPHHAADRLVTPLDQRGYPEGVADLDVGHLTNEDRDPVLGADHHLLQIARALDQPEASDHRPGPAPLDHVTPHVAVAPHDRIDDGGEGDPEAAEPVGIDVDLILADQPAHARHLGHSGNRIELIPNEPVLNRPQLAEGVALPL